MNQRWLQSLAITSCVIGLAGVSHAQSVTLTSATWNTPLNQPTVVGSPNFGATLTGAAAGNFGAPSLALLATTSVTFPAGSGFIMAITPGAGSSTGTATGSFTFNIGGGASTISVPITYSVANPTGLLNAVVGISSTPVDFSILGNIFRFTLNTVGASVPANNANENVAVTGSLLYVSVAPEPGTVALFGLGILPVAAAIRRRRK